MSLQRSFGATRSVPRLEKRSTNHYELRKSTNEVGRNTEYVCDAVCGECVRAARRRRFFKENSTSRKQRLKQVKTGR